MSRPILDITLVSRKGLARERVCQRKEGWATECEKNHPITIMLAWLSHGLEFLWSSSNSPSIEETLQIQISHQWISNSKKITIILSFNLCSLEINAKILHLILKIWPGNTRLPTTQQPEDSIPHSSLWAEVSRSPHSPPSLTLQGQRWGILVLSSFKGDKEAVPARNPDEDRLSCGQFSLNWCSLHISSKAMEIHFLIFKQCPKLLPSKRPVEGQRGKQVTADLLFTATVNIKL